VVEVALAEAVAVEVLAVEVPVLVLVGEGQLLPPVVHSVLEEVLIEVAMSG